MKTDKEIVRAMVLIELGSKEAFKTNENIVFSSLNLFKTFKLEFHLSNSVFYSILKLLNSFEILNTSVGEKVLNRLKWNYFIKKFPVEYIEALKETQRILNKRKAVINE